MFVGSGVLVPGGPMSCVRVLVISLVGFMRYALSPVLGLVVSVIQPGDWSSGMFRCLMLRQRLEYIPWTAWRFGYVFGWSLVMVSVVQ